jgi:iron complex outermembrane receptor protein
VVNGIPTFVGVTTNAGKASFKGVELETVATLYRSADRLAAQFHRHAGLSRRQYDEFITNVAGFDANGNATPGSRAQPIDVADFRRIQNTPKWTTSGTLDYSTPLHGGELSASTTVSYRSKTFQFETPSPFLDQKGYALLDASLVWQSDGGVTIGLHGKNLTDKQYKTSGYQFLAVTAFRSPVCRSATPPATSGVRARASSAALLLLAYIFNFLDRQILGILAGRSRPTST